MSGTYKPTEHGGLKQDGTEDKRVVCPQGLYGVHQDTVQGGVWQNWIQSSSKVVVFPPVPGKVDPHQAGQAGGHASGGSSESTGSSGGSSGGNGQFAGGKVDPADAGRKGGQTSH
ncbi:hypothetical protein KCU93_g8138, partial [Aureobasidium melanogenum]